MGLLKFMFLNFFFEEYRHSLSELFININQFR